MVRRAGAKPGDRVFVSGTHRRRRARARAAQRRARWKLSAAQRQHLASRYLLPQPRNALAEAVRSHASAAMDVSDGLAGDFAKLCRASQVAAEIEVARVPLSDAAKAVLAAEPAHARDRAHRRRRLRDRLHRAGGQGRKLPRRGAGGRCGGDRDRRRSRRARAPGFSTADGKPLTFKRASFSHF